MAAVKQAVLTRDHDPESEAVIFFLDIRGQGKDFDRYVLRAKDPYGVRFVGSMPSRVIWNPVNNNLFIEYYDRTGYEHRREEFDQVVLSAGMKPSSSLAPLLKSLGLELNSYGFVAPRPRTALSYLPGGHLRMRDPGRPPGHPRIRCQCRRRMRRRLFRHGSGSPDPANPGCPGFHETDPGQVRGLPKIHCHPSPMDLLFPDGRGIPEFCGSRDFWISHQPAHCHTKVHSNRNCPSAGLSPLLEIFTQHVRATLGATWYHS